MKYCVYFYYIGEELVYVGESINVYERYLQHCYQDEEFKKVDKIGVMECNNKTDMDLLEIYYITKLKPRMNGTHVDRDKSTIKIEHNEIVEYTLDEFREKYEVVKEHSDKSWKQKQKEKFIEFLKTTKDAPCYPELNTTDIIKSILMNKYIIQSDDMVCLIRLGSYHIDKFPKINELTKIININNFILYNTSGGRMISRLLDNILKNKINVNEKRSYYIKDKEIATLYKAVNSEKEKKMIFERTKVDVDGFIYLNVYSKYNRTNGSTCLLGLNHDDVTNDIKIQIKDTIEENIRILEML